MGIQDKYPHKSPTVLNDWTAVGLNTIVASVAIELREKSKQVMHIQAALDTADAHLGTRFIVETSASYTGNADWYPLTEFVALIGTAAKDDIEDAPLAAGSTDIALTGHAMTVEGKLLFIEGVALADSEIVREASHTANEVVILDGTENEHAVGTDIYNVAIAQVVDLPSTALRARLLVDNTYDATGSTLDYRATVVTANEE